MISFSFFMCRAKVTPNSNLIERFKSHNILSSKGFSVKYRPWIVIHVEFFKTKSEAMKREKYFKFGVGREYIKEIKITT